MKQEIIRWKLMAHMLLGQHFGLTLNDTEFCDDCVVESLVADGTSPVDAINALVDKYDLTRLNASNWRPQSPYLSNADELIAAIQAAESLTLVVGQRDERGV